MTPLRIAYLAASNELSGGVRVILAQADALVLRRHYVEIFSTEPPPTWRKCVAPWVQVRDLRAAPVQDHDYVVATFWTTVKPAFELAGNRAVHLCQGYEGAFSAYQMIKEDIDAAYRLPLPKVVVARQLVDVCRRFTEDVTLVGQIVDDVFFQQRLSPKQNEPPRLLVSGPWEADMKGIDVAYEAVRRSKADGAIFDLVRVSPWAPSREEPTDLASEFHTKLDSEDMAKLTASVSLFLGTNRRAEGFGLPAAESLASGIPAILSSIPSYCSWDSVRDYAVFVPEGDPGATSNAILNVLGATNILQKLSKRGREVAEQFRSSKAAERLEDYFTARLRK
jgi:glycosyltransferase involved in cell wall biosynthesis